jgi:hypothetical protein
LLYYWAVLAGCGLLRAKVVPWIRRIQGTVTSITATLTIEYKMTSPTVPPEVPPAQGGKRFPE